MEEQEFNEMKKLVEAALFMSPSVVSLNDLAKIAHTHIGQARIVLNQLIQEYAERDSAICIEEETDGFRMKVRPEFEGNVLHLASSPEFHKGIMKTLAFIAYKQPVLQSEVIKFRNSKAYEHVKVLKEKGFILKEKQGITYKLTTTKKFREYFGEVKKGQEKLKAKEIPEEISEPPKIEKTDTIYG